MYDNQVAEKKHITEVSDLIFQASNEIKILTHLSWPSSIREAFFQKKAQQLPIVTYPKFDAKHCLSLIKKARSKLNDSFIDDWMLSKIDSLETCVALLTHCGTPKFFDYSKELYGEPKTPLIDKKSTPLKLADQFNKILESVSHVDLGAPPEACILAETVAFEMEKAVKDMFADKAPPVFVVDELSANALAGATRIRIRRGACFSDRDVEQLIQHEAFIHVATALNGLDQPILKMLSVSTPDNTKTQEGLAVFAELITGCIDLDRMRRLADRVVAIQMAIDGADFIEVFRYFCERVGSEEQAFENARRVFRGGMVEGGAPFTKDVVYLDGLLRVHNFLRALVSVGRPDCLRLLFCGKLDLDDIPILGWMVNTGMCKPATYLPPWASDLRFLLSYLAYSSFLNTISFADEKEHYATLLKDVPKIS